MKRSVVTALFLAVVFTVISCQKATKVATPKPTVVETKVAIVVTSTQRPQATLTRTPTAVLIPSLTQAQTKVATLTATAIMVPTATRTPVPTETAFFRKWIVEVIVKGLPEDELPFLKFKFSNEVEKEVVLVSRNGNLYTFPEEPVWVKAVGSEDGRHPWEKFWVKGDQNPKKIQANIYTGQLVVVFNFGRK